MLCRRSASLTSSTRTSAEMASSSLRRFSACASSRETRLQPLDLGQAIDDGADLGAEQLVDLGAGRVGVLDGVVQQRHGDGGVVELEVGEDGGDFERMVEVRVARGALLRAVLLHGVDIGLVEQLLVGVRVVGLHPLDELVLTHHRGAALPGGLVVRPCRANKKAPGRKPDAFTTIERSKAADQSSRRSGGARLSMPRSSSSSVMVSKVSPSSSASASSSGAACLSGSSTSTYFCSEWIRSSRRSSGEMAPSPISRSATTGFLSLSRSTVICGAGRNHAGAVRGHQHEVEAVLDLFNAVFNGDAGHGRLQRMCGMSGSHTRARPATARIRRDNAVHCDLMRLLRASDQWANLLCGPMFAALLMTQSRRGTWLEWVQPAADRLIFSASRNRD